MLFSYSRNNKKTNWLIETKPALIDVGIEHKTASWKQLNNKFSRFGNPLERVFQTMKHEYNYFFHWMPTAKLPIAYSLNALQ